MTRTIDNGLGRATTTETTVYNRAGQPITRVLIDNGRERDLYLDTAGSLVNRVAVWENPIVQRAIRGAFTDQVRAAPEETIWSVGGPEIRSSQNVLRFVRSLGFGEENLSASRRAIKINGRARAMPGSNWD